MADFANEAIETIKQTLNLKLLLYFFAVFLLQSLAALIVAGVFILIGAAAILPYFGSFTIESFQALLSNQAAILSILSIVVPLAIVWALVELYINAFFSGLKINLFNNFANGEGLSIGSAFGPAAKRAFTYFKIQLLIGIAAAAIAAIIAAMVLLPFFSLKTADFASAGPAVAIAIVLVLLLLFALMIGLFLLSPFLWLFMPIAFFEKKGTIDSIKRSIALAKPNYWENIVFIIIFMLVTFVVSLLMSAIQRMASMAFLFPTIMLAETSSADTMIYSMMGAMPAVMAVTILFSLPFTIWIEAYGIAALRNLYFLNKPKGKT